MASARAALACPRARSLAAVGAAALVVLLILSDLATPLDQRLFDLTTGLSSRTTPSQVVVVAIDQSSLIDHGPWPWPRRDLARLVDRLTAAGSRAAGLQLLLAQPTLYDPQGDALLAQAIARNGAVVLPVTPDLAGSSQTVLLPAPALAAAAAALGHSEMQADNGGVIRRLALHAGLGAPHWPAFAQALAELSPSPANAPSTPTSAASGHILQTSDTTDMAARWTGANIVLLAPPAHGMRIDQFSAIDVLEGRTSPAALKGKTVLLGRTDLPDERLSLPGKPEHLAPVELQAQVLAELLEGRTVWPMPVLPQIALSVCLVILPLLLPGLPAVRRPWIPLVVGVATLLGVTWGVLRAGAWFPPSSVLLVLAAGLGVSALSAACRAWRRSHADADTGVANRQCFDIRLERTARSAHRHGSPLSLLLLEVRDTASLPADLRAVLAVAVAAGLQRSVRAPRDLIARLDNGRFAALLPATPAHVAVIVATALMVDLEGLPERLLPTTAGRPLRMGLASLLPDDVDAGDLLLRATRDLVTPREPAPH